MTNFGSYLGQIIASDWEGHRANFAEACGGLNPASISNYLTKGELPSFETLGRVANAVVDTFKRAELVAAYWRDIQERAAIKGVDVDIRPLVKSGKPDAVEEEVRTIITTLQKRARRDPVFRRIIKDIADWP